MGMRIGWLGLVIVMSMSGCSFVGARGVANPKTPGGRDCASTAWPATDGVVAAAALGMILYSLIAYPRCKYGDCDQDADDHAKMHHLVSTIAFAPPAAVFGLSAMYGATVISGCRDNQQANMHRALPE